MARPVCYPSAGKRRALKLCRAFAAGCGGRVAPAGQNFLEPGPAFFYGWTPHTKALLDACVAEKRPWFYADNGYFGRGRYFRVTRGALQHDGKGDAGPARLRTTGIEIQPWRRDGEHIVIATQSEAFYREHLGTTREAWCADILRRINSHSDRPLLVCRKPAPKDMEARSFTAALARAWAVVGHSSNALVEAVIAGVPVFPQGPCAASAMGLRDLSRIEAPLRPKGRAPWLWNLAANQWSLAELEDGTCWRDLRRVANGPG